jgi:hypothetical protein
VLISSTPFQQVSTIKHPNVVQLLIRLLLKTSPPGSEYGQAISEPFGSIHLLRRLMTVYEKRQSLPLKSVDFF